MKMIIDYEVEGCWSADPDGSKCRVCGTIEEIVPREGHYNSYFWRYKRNDGMILICCPKGCSVEEADKKQKEYSSVRIYCKDGSHSYKWELDYTRVTDGYINRRGRLYPCEFMDHKNFCYEQFGKGEEELDKAGYVRMSGGEFMWYSKAMTKKQLGTIVDWCNANKKKSSGYVRAYESNEDFFINS